MTNSITKIAILLIGALITLTLSVWLWSTWPIIVNSDRPDPAVLLANEIGNSDNLYHEGFTGETGTRLHYVTAGEGEPIIFIHGFPSYWFTMFGLTEAFKSDYQVIAIDGLGVGRSDAPGDVEAYKIERLIGHVDRMIEELDLGPVHLVGHDWGSAIAVGYAQAHPSKVKTVTAMSALPHNVLLARLQYDREHQDRFSYVDQFSRANPVLIWALGIQDQIWDDVFAPFVEEGILSPREGARLRADIGNPRRLNRFINWYRANLPSYQDISEDDFWPSRTARLSVPAIFIYGSNDPVVTSQLVTDFAELSDSLQVLVLEDVGHRPHFERREFVVEEIRTLIERGG